MNPSTTHIAGNHITVNGRTIQRCALCGEKLIDSKNQAGVIGPNGELPGVATWQPGRLVSVSGGNPSRSVLLPDAERLPDDSCIDLVE